MLKRVKLLGISLILCCFIYWGRLAVTEILEDETALVEEWLDQNDLGDFKKIFKDYGISTLSGCGSPEQLERLPELPASEERRLRRAAHALQQRLVLRQWLATRRLQHTYSKLLSLDVSSLEDVYWLEDSSARHVLEAKDFSAWSAARQSLPTGKEALQTLKADLWSAVVKSSKHQDAWTWGGMLVVSVSVCGLVTLAAMTQPSLAPEAKHSLLQYVTGKYLHPGSCRVEWGWEEPQVVGETMCFKVVCFQRNGQPYPVSDADDLAVIISHATRKITPVIELGSDDPGEANAAKVNFTVRSSGLYIISVTIGGAMIQGSPFRRRFVADAVCARVSLVSPAPLVCRVRQPRALHVTPRDQYGNVAPPHPHHGFTVELQELGEEEPDESLAEAATFSVDAVNQRVSVALRFPRPGVFQATLRHGSARLQQAPVTCLVLTASDMARMERNLSRRGGASYEARAGGRRLLACVGPASLTLREYFLKLIPKRVASFRLCASTKLILHPRKGEGPAGDLTIEDGVQEPLTLWAPQRDLLAATYTQLQLAHSSTADTFKNKQEYFYSSLRRLHARHAHDKLPLRVQRADLVRSSLRATRGFGVADWCRAFDVSFHGEQGVDWGGVRREWVSLVCARLFGSRAGLFAALHEPAGLVHPNPAHTRPPHLKLKHFELAGKIVGKCLYESALGGPHRQLVRARFTRSFLAQLIGLRVHYKHFETDDPELFLTKIKYVLEADLDAADAPADLTFSDELYDAQGRLVATHCLVPDGANIRVNNASKLEYLQQLAAWRLGGAVRAELAAFLRGLALLVPGALLAAFSEPELELLLCGLTPLSVADWRRHTVLGGSGRSWERVVEWFWAAVTSFSPAERARLLQFTTGSGQLPPGGFQDLSPRFQLSAGARVGALPSAHTCFNQLVLPHYDSYEQLVRALLCAVNEGGEGFSMI